MSNGTTYPKTEPVPKATPNCTKEDITTFAKGEPLLTEEREYSTAIDSNEEFIESRGCRNWNIEKTRYRKPRLNSLRNFGDDLFVGRNPPVLSRCIHGLC